MDSSSPPLVSDLVLVGGGHSHVHVLKMLGMPAGRRLLWENGIRVTLIARDVHTPYSGMLPGYVAGHYSLDQIHLDLAKLCRFANVRLVVASAQTIVYNESDKYVLCNDGRPPIRYDALSINIGSAPSGTPPKHVTPVKPIAHFANVYQQLQQRLRQSCTNYSPSKPFSLVVVGGGAGGIELALSVKHNIETIFRKHQKAPQPDTIKIAIVTKSESILAQHTKGVRRIFQRILRERGIRVHSNATVVDVVIDDETKKKKLVLSADSSSSSSTSLIDPLCFDECLWCTSAGASTWLKDNTPFSTTPDGFVRVNDTFECINHPGVFAAGDCCHNVHHPRPKAGVFAVRAGPPLKDNLLRYLTNRPLKPFTPQKHFLSLISTGNPYAVASRGDWFAMEGRYLWTIKDRIDRKWMAKYTTDLPDLEEMMEKMNFRRQKNRVPAAVQRKGRDVLEAFSADPMRCGGCGAKVGATTVSRVLAAVHQRQLLRADASATNSAATPRPIDHDDAAIVPVSEAGAMIHTIDYFRSFLSDPYVFGKIAAVHALSDVHAMGSKAQTALALAVVPFAAEEAITESTLLDLLSGASDVLQDENISIVGGHTCEGTELACGFAIQGFTNAPQRLLRKRGGKPGDKIVLTKPIGTGALFAADMRAKCKGQHMVEALDSMVLSNGKASEIAANNRAGGVHACTDVTGFGLMGHLLEMLLASSSDNNEALDAVLDLRSVPFLEGGIAASKDEIFSSLHPQNSRNRRAVYNHADVAAACPVEYPLLFDPQTAGGLMFFVDPNDCHSFCDQLRKHYPHTSIIGELQAHEGPVAEQGICVIGSGSETSGLRVRVNY